MNTFNRKVISGLAFVAALSSGHAMAADGTLGVDSTGSTDITLEIADRVQITSIANIPLGAYSGSGPLVGTTEFCVYRSGGDNYQLTLTADTGAYQVASVLTGDNIPFTAKVDDDLDASDTTNLGYNTASGALVGSSSLTCGGVDNAELEVSFLEGDLQAASTANDYAATVTIFVEPI